MRDLGFHYRITDIQCALGISQLNKLKNLFLIEEKSQIIMTNYFKIPGIKVLQI